MQKCCVKCIFTENIFIIENKQNYFNNLAFYYIYPYLFNIQKICNSFRHQHKSALYFSSNLQYRLNQPNQFVIFLLLRYCCDHCHCPAPFSSLCLAKGVFSPVRPLLWVFETFSFHCYLLRIQQILCESYLKQLAFNTNF